MLGIGFGRGAGGGDKFTRHAPPSSIHGNAMDEQQQPNKRKGIQSDMPNTTTQSVRCCLSLWPTYSSRKYPRRMNMMMRRGEVRPPPLCLMLPVSSTNWLQCKVVVWSHTDMRIDREAAFLPCKLNAPASPSPIKLSRRSSPWP